MRASLVAPVLMCLALTLPASASATAASAISAGGAHTCAILRTSAMECWGENTVGQLGDGTTTGRVKPTPVSGLDSGVIAISAGARHTCALTSGGAAKCWGENFGGEVGDGTDARKMIPAPVRGLAQGVVAIAAGGDHTCALTSAGAVECWGLNDRGAVGDGTKVTRTTPVQVSTLESGIAAISVGASHSCALTGAGAVECWGANYAGQLGDGGTSDSTVPVPVNGLGSGVVAIGAGGNHTCALTSGGTVTCWGDNATSPVVVSGLSGVSAITAGSNDTCALTEVGAMECWGENGEGQLGDGTVTAKSSPAAVYRLATGVIAISAGTIHTCALTIGPAKCWGRQGVGDGTELDRTTPVNVVGLYRSTCATNAGSVKLSPGLTVTPAVQSVVVKGTLSGCTGGAFSTIKYRASLTTEGSISCETLTTPGAGATGSAAYKWVPTSVRAAGTLSTLLSELPGSAFSGEIDTGAYAPLALTGSITTTYRGGSTCGQSAGRKAANSVKDGTFSGSAITLE